jgi:2-hydroxyglutarate dehydrogenase
VVGGGIVGAATARQLLKSHPYLRVVLLDKERDLGVHQSGRNSGVIHAGIYYAPGSLKAQLCVKGLDLAYAYFEERGIPYKKVGKLIVAVDDSEVERLNVLYQRGLDNGVRDLQLIDGERIPEIEPHCRGKKAILSPHTGIVDWGRVTRELGAELESSLGGEVRTDAAVTDFALRADGGGIKSTYPLAISVKNKGTIFTKYAITCAGLQADRVAALSGCSAVPKIVPFRGEYLLLKHDKRHLCRGNIYPVPNPQFPFLGVHFTPRMSGDVWLGPNAVLAYAREGYGYSNINLRDTLEALTFSGMRKLVWRHLGYGLGELARSIWIRRQVEQLRRFIPELRLEDVTRGPSGVRAQALDADGTLVDDFVFDQGVGPVASRLLHVRNAPSPAATSSLAIAEMVVEKAEIAFQLAKELN